MKSLELKVKAKSLAAESRIIRTEEHKITKQMASDLAYDHQANVEKLEWSRSSLAQHRRHNVKNASRATELARAYLSGKKYSSVEQSRRKEKEVEFQNLIIPRVASMVSRYGAQTVTPTDITKWTDISPTVVQGKASMMKRFEDRVFA